MSSISRLPQELLDVIIDHLYDDNTALRRCTLVSRSWLQASRYHLYRTLRISDEYWHHNFVAFDNFLRNDASPGFCAEVRSLTMRGDEGSYDFPQRTLLSRDLLMSILGRLPHLSVLIICDIRLQEAQLPSLSPRFSLEKLVLSSVGSSRDSPRNIVQLLSMFTDIGTLHANFVDSWYEPALSQGNTSPLGPHSNTFLLKVDKLHLRGWTTINCLVDIMRRSQFVHMLQSIDVECTDTREIVSVGDLMNDAGENLSHVAIDLSLASREERDAWEVTQALRFDSAVRLESFHICAFPNLTLPLAVAMSRMTQATECLLRILSTLAPTIKRVTIEIGPSDIVQDPPIMWETLAMVEWQRFVDLERVTVFMRRGGSTQAAEEIRQKLRILDKKGLLSIAGDQAEH